MSLQRWSIRLVSVASILFGTALLSRPQPTSAQNCAGVPAVDGRDFSTKYGSPILVQNNPTGFGDQSPGVVADSEGSELDQMFLANDPNFLLVGLTGNTPRQDTGQNTIIVFIDTGAGGGSTVLATAAMSGSLALVNMDGVTLDFAPNYALTVWTDGGITNTGLLYDLTNPTDAGTPLAEGVEFALDNTNLLGVNAEVASDPLQQEINATTATTGLELKISLASLGFTTPIVASTTIKTQAIIVSNTGSVSNQSLPPLNPTVSGVGGGVGCLGIHDPGATPPNLIDFGSVSFPGLQFHSYLLDHTGTDPGVVLDGAAIPTDFGGAAASTQNNHTCFGDAAAFSPATSNGSEIDEIYVTSDGQKLYIGITGNLPANDTFNNTITVFVGINDFNGVNQIPGPPLPGDPPVLNGGSGAIQGIANVFLHSGFMPRYAIQYWRSGGQHHATVEDLAFDTPEIPLEFTTDVTRHLDPALNTFGVDLGNVDGVNNIAGDDPQEAKAVTAVHGVQFSIRLGTAPPTGLDYNVLADPGIDIVAAVISGTGFISNQFLPPLRKTTGVVLMSNDTIPAALAISDATGGGPSTISSTAPLTDAATQGLQRVTGIEVTVNITHPDMGQLKIDLHHPASNRTVVLWNQEPAGAGQADLNATFAVGGADLSTWTPGNPGPFEVSDPVNNPLSTFNDVDPTDGDWVLFVTDFTPGGTGTLNTWSVKLTETVGGGVDCIGFSDFGNPLNIATAFPTAEVIHYNVNPGFEDGPPTFGANPAGSNIPSVYPTPAKATQNNYTCFGDAIPTGLPNNPGNEMDDLFISNTEDRLQIAIGGNLIVGADGNAFILLFDTKPGGLTSPFAGLPTPPRPIGGDANNPGENGLNGMTMDAGFQPDFALSTSEFFGGYKVEFVDLTTMQTFLRGFQSFDSLSGLLNPPGLSPGSELDELFLQNDATNLYIGFTGNLEGNGNAFIIFLDTVPGGSPVLATGIGRTLGWPVPLSGTSSIPGQNGVEGDILNAAFGPEYAIVVDRQGAFFQTAKLVDLNDFVNPPTDIPFATNFTIAPNTFVGNNDNVDGVNNLSSDDPAQQAINAATATTGLQFAIDRTSIGSPADGTAIGVSVILVGGTGYWSNQALPGLGGGLDNLSATMEPVDAATAGHTFAAYTLSAVPAAPATYDGTAIPTAMAGGPNPLATQNNYTGFGDQIADPTFDNTNCTQVAFDNSNLQGVTGCGTPCVTGSVVGAELVQTGMELDIALADLGLGPVVCGSEPTIKALALLGNNTGFVSNQLLPGIGGGGFLSNLGRGADLSTVSGTQFFSHTLTFPCGCDPADINGDGLIDQTDVIDLIAVLLGNSADPCTLQNADVNGDTFTDGLDVQTYVSLVVP